LPKPNADINSYSDSYSDADGNLNADSDVNADGNLNAYSDVNAYSDRDAYSYNSAQAHAYAAVSPNSAATALICKISWLDSETRERKLASFCFVDRAHSLTLIRIQLCDGRVPGM
jgi:hypothetical protein